MIYKSAMSEEALCQHLDLECIRRNPDGHREGTH